MTDQQNYGYGIDQSTPEQLGTAPIPAGINENVKFVDLAYEPAKEGSQNMCLSFYFEDSKGAQLRHTEWPIDIEETKQRAAKRGDDPNTAVQKRFQAQGVRIKHIATKVLPEEQVVVPKSSTFAQYAQGVVNLLKPHLPKGPFRLKVLLNNKNYSTLPPYTPFIETQVEGEATRLKIGTDEKVTPSGKNANGGNLEMPADGGFSDDDTPF